MRRKLSSRWTSLRWINPCGSGPLLRQMSISSSRRLARMAICAPGAAHENSSAIRSAKAVGSVAVSGAKSRAIIR